MGIRCLAAIILAVGVQAQPREPLNFEAASVRTADHDPPRRGMLARGETLGGPGTDDPTRITYTWVPMRSLLTGAFGGDEILNLPDWTAVDRFDLRANLPGGATKEQAQEMMQNLLKDRFN